MILSELVDIWCSLKLSVFDEFWRKSWDCLVPCLYLRFYFWIGWQDCAVSSRWERTCRLRTRAVGSWSKHWSYKQGLPLQLFLYYSLLLCFKLATVSSCCSLQRSIRRRGNRLHGLNIAEYILEGYRPRRWQAEISPDITIYILIACRDKLNHNVKQRVRYNKNIIC